MLALCIAAIPFAPAQAKNRCVIADPSGTPLNVRTGPNGKIVSIIRNGHFVSVVDSALDSTRKPWSYVSDYETGEPIGWVFRSFLVCRETPSSEIQSSDCRVADPSSTPLNVRTTPYGKVISTLPDGKAVTIIDSDKDKKGNPWAYVSDDDTGEPIGWVYRRFIQCK